MQITRVIAGVNKCFGTVLLTIRIHTMDPAVEQGAVER